MFVHLSTAVSNPADLQSSLRSTHAWLSCAWDGRGPILVLTGAGISAESGVSTFRGEEGYWRIGSRNYFPEELATRTAFAHMPDQIWGWYLYRRSVCRAAQPNDAHHALSKLERELTLRGESDRFLLVTQNVDGLHLRAGNTIEHTFQIHGNIDFMRSVDDGDVCCYRLPPELGEHWERGTPIGPRERDLLVCPNGRPARPHVLWFDESYDEECFRFRSTLAAVELAGIVIVVGTSGSTTLPSMIVQRAVERRVPLLVVNQDSSSFSEIASRIPTGHFLQSSAAKSLPALVEMLIQRSVSQ